MALAGQRTRSGNELADELADVMRARSASWRALAACRDMPAVMYPARPGQGRLVDYGPALAVCVTCPVREPCHDAGKAEPLGVWGGTTPADRGYAGRRRGP